MKEATLEQFVQDPHAFVRASQQERVLVTQNGQPLAMVVGVEHKDAEDWQLEASPEFCAHDRRAAPATNARARCRGSRLVRRRNLIVAWLNSLGKIDQCWTPRIAKIWSDS